MGLFQGSWEMNPYAKKLWEQLFSQYRGVPDWIRQQADIAGKKVRRWGARELPAGVASGNIGSMEMQARAGAMAGTGEAKESLMRMLLGLSSQAQYKQPAYKDIMDILI